MSVLIVRAFVRLREMLASNRELAEKIGELESRVDSHDQTIQQIISAIKLLMQPTATPPKQIGFRPEQERKPKAVKGRAHRCSNN